MIKAVIFDCDGVLMDSIPKNAKNYTKAFAQYSLAFDTTLASKLFGSGAEAIVRRQLELHGKYEPELFQNVLDAYRKESSQSVFPLHKDVVDFLNQLKVQGFVVGVASNRTKEVLAEMLKGANILHYFGAVVGISDGVRIKPFPDMYLQAAKELYCAPEECVVVEDSIIGLKAALDAGMQVVAVNTGSKEYDDLFAFLSEESIGDFQVVDNVMEIDLRRWN